MEEIRLMKGNEVVAEAAVRCGCDGYFGYPITPQSEILETLTAMRPWETTGMVVLQAESEVAAVNMLYGGAACGRRVMASSSSPGISLMCEGLSYLAGAELPCVVVDVSRGGAGLGTIQPSQADYFQAVKGGGHGDYHLIVLAPNSVQEMYDFVPLGFELAFKYRNPVMILSDGVIGQMMEKVMLTEPQPRWSDAYIAEHWGGWATTGKPADRNRQAVFARAEHRYVRRTRSAAPGAVQPETVRKVPDDPRKRGALRGRAVRRCRLRIGRLRVFRAYFPESGRAGSRGGTESRTATAGYALSVPDRSDRRTVAARQRFPVGRNEHRADDRGRAVGRPVSRSGIPFRAHGRRGAFAERGAGGAEKEFFVKVEVYG